MDRGCRCQDRLHRAGQPLGGYIESFNARLRDELLNGEIFYTLCEAQIVMLIVRSPAAPVVRLEILGQTLTRLAVLDARLSTKASKATSAFFLGLGHPVLLESPLGFRLLFWP
jgi:hypothetical protein